MKDSNGKFLTNVDIKCIEGGMLHWRDWILLSTMTPPDNSLHSHHLLIKEGIEVSFTVRDQAKK